MKPIKFLFISLLCCTFSNWNLTVQAQSILKGKVYDAESGELLPSAAVYIDGSFRGTVTNAEGEFSLKVSEWPTTVIVQFLGYQTKQTVLNELPEDLLEIKLKADSFELEEIIVTDEDPGVKIMREVIRRKLLWQKNLKSYKADGYSRYSLSNDTAIALITETVTELYWEKGKGPREIIKSKKQTSNFMESANMGGLRYIPNFYDDKLDIVGFDLFTPTHPDAIANYQFKLVDQTSLDGKQVYKIEVKPKKELQPLFTGYVWVLGTEYALLKVSLRPNDVVRFPAPIKEMKMAYEQQFSNFGSDFWLPLDFRSTGKLKIKMVGLEFPLFQFDQNARITDYQVNISLPDTLFNKGLDDVIVDSTTINQPDSLYFQKIDAIPLTDEESVAYVKLDSSKSISQAFKPKGFLAKQFDIEMEIDGETANQDSLDKANQNFFQKLGNFAQIDARFNRVDGFYTCLKKSIRFSKKVNLSLNGGYSFALEEASFGSDLSVKLGDRYAPVLIGGFNRNTETRYDALFTETIGNSLFMLYGKKDYFDWYRRDQAYLGLRKTIKGLGQITGSLKIEEGRSVQNQTDYDLFGSDPINPVNPFVEEGRIHSLNLGWTYGAGPENMQVFGENGFAVNLELSNSSIGSDYQFARFNGQLNLSIPTFLKRRFIPNKLDIIGYAAIQFGDELPQRQGILESSQFEFTQFGAFRTYIGRPLAGSNLASLHVEHNFQTVPFETLGLDFLVKRDIGLLVFAGSGVVGGQDFSNNGYFFPQSSSPIRTGVEWIHEAGFSVNKLFGILRLNAGWSLSHDKFVLSGSVAKFF